MSAATGIAGPIRGIHHTSRSVSNMDRSLGFYRDLLGMDVLLDTEMQGEMLDREVGLDGARVQVVELGIEGEPMLELLGYSSPLPRDWEDDLRPCDAGAHHIALLVDDIAASYEALTAAGIEFTYPPQEVDAGYFEGHWTAYCYDPDHLIVELWQLRS